MPTAAGQLLLDSFERIRIINLKHRADRRKEMISEFRRLGLNIDGHKIAFHDACKPDDAGHFPSIGARGCFTSHYDILAEALAANVRNVLILEDDLDFVGTIEKDLPPVLTELFADDWSIFYGGYEQYAGPTDTPLLSLAPSDEGIRTTHFLALNRTAIELAVPYLKRMAERPAGDPEGGPMHVDGAYGWLRQAYPQLRTWLATPELGHQRPSRTDIHILGWQDQLSVIRGITAFCRRLKRRKKA